MNKQKFKFLKSFLIFVILLLFCMGCATATEDKNNMESSTTTSELGNLDRGTCPANLESDKIDNGESCAVTSAKTLLTSKGISYNETRLNKCICKDKDCNANIATINKCLEESGLKTYTYKTNQTMLKTGDIIHLEINRIGHYIIYEENKTDLTNFTGYTITTKELTEQKTIPLAIQKKIHGQMHTMECKYWDRWKYEYVFTGRYEIKWVYKGTAFLWGRIYRQERVPIYKWKWVNHPYWGCK